MVQRGTCQHSQLQDSTSQFDQLTAWTEDWCVTVNKDKSSTTLFTLSPKKQARPIKIGTHTLKEEDQATNLGVTFDKRLYWKPHTLRTEGKARKKMAIMRKLARTTWGSNEQILMTVYKGSVRPILGYSSTAWSTTAKTNQQSLDKIQNQALLIITGAMKSTPDPFVQKRFKTKIESDLAHAGLNSNHVEF